VDPIGTAITDVKNGAAFLVYHGSYNCRPHGVGVATTFFQLTNEMMNIGNCFIDLKFPPGTLKGIIQMPYSRAACNVAATVTSEAVRQSDQEGQLREFNRFLTAICVFSEQQYIPDTTGIFVLIPPWPPSGKGDNRKNIPLRPDAFHFSLPETRKSVYVVIFFNFDYTG
jgi:hypothetical protein